MLQLTPNYYGSCDFPRLSQQPMNGTSIQRQAQEETLSFETIICQFGMYLN